VDTYLTNTWSIQYIRDIDEITSDTFWSSEAYAGKLYSFLVEKYFCRRWFVVVIPDWNDNGNKFSINTCDGYKELHLQDKHFFINSVASEESSMTRLSAQTRLRNLQLNPLKLFLAFRAKASILNKEMNLSCRHFDMFGSVRDEDDIAIYGSHVSVVTYVEETLYITKYKSFIMV